MRYFPAILVFMVTALSFNSCKDKGFPVPPASTVSKFSYTVDNENYAPASATFSNLSIVPDEVGDAFFIWDFGDGTTSTDVNPVHKYTAPGSFKVTLTVKTTISLEIRQSSSTIVVLNSAASGIQAYFTDGSKVYSGFLNNDTPAFTALPIGPFDDSYGMAIDTINSKLYISDSGTGTIYQYDTEKGTIVNFRTGLSSPDGLAIDFKNGKLYWDTDNGIQRTSLSSTTPTDVEDFVTGQTNDPEGVSIDAAHDKLYWVNYDGGLWSINLDGTGKTQLLAEPEGGSTLVIGNRVYFDYYVGSGDIHIKSTDLDGKNMSTITTGISKVVFGLAYEAKGKKIYWGNRGSGKIMRGNLDGSNIETWYSAAGSSPRGIVFGKKK